MGNALCTPILLPPTVGIGDPDQLSHYVAIATVMFYLNNYQKIALPQQQQQITKNTALARGLLCSKVAIFLRRFSQKEICTQALHRKQQSYYAHSNEVFNTQAPKDGFSCNKLIKHWRRLDRFQTVGLLTPIAQELLPSARRTEN